jgi:crotonobetainyl-CoA:carnitine CoA-transferase CaiB-like acyl-CoA transferase
MANLAALTTLMDAVLATRTRDEWIARFDAAGVPVGPVNSIGEALAHPQTLARGMVVDLVHPRAGPTKALGCPLHFSGTPTAITRPALVPVKITREVLCQRRRLRMKHTDAFAVAAGVVEDAGRLVRD